MKVRRGVDEMTRYLQQVREFVRSAPFEAERRLAREEFYGSADVAVVEEEEGLDCSPAYFDWFAFDRCHSEEAQTPVRMYVTQHPDLPDRIRLNLLALEQSLSGVFWIGEVHADHLVVLDMQGEDSDFYRVNTAEPCGFGSGELIQARLLRWDDAYYFHGEVAAWPTATGDVAPQPQGFRGHNLQRPSGLNTRQAWLRQRRTRP